MTANMRQFSPYRQAIFLNFFAEKIIKIGYDYMGVETIRLSHKAKGAVAMKIRLMGNNEELEIGVEKLKETFEIISVSAPYKNRNSTESRVYVEVKVKEK